MPEPIRLTLKAVQESPTLHDLYLRQVRAIRVNDVPLVSALEAEITALLGGRTLEIIRQEGDVYPPLS